MCININGTEYPLATTLRVAYKVQSCNNHASYTKVFEQIGDAPLEKQIELLYCAFQVGNPESKMKFQEFLDAYLDNYDLRSMLSHIKSVVEGIMGPDLDKKNTESSDASTSEQGN